MPETGTMTKVQLSSRPEPLKCRQQTGVGEGRTTDTEPQISPRTKSGERANAYRFYANNDRAFRFFRFDRFF
jgi:hypothetical protein